MNISNREIRVKAREALGNSFFDKTWLLAAAVSIVLSIIMTLVSYIGSFGSILLTGPIYVGLHIVFLKIVRKDEFVRFSNAFDGINNFGSNVMLGLMYGIIVFLWSLLFLIPGIMKSYSYSLIYFIKADHPEYGWRECLAESERLMKGNRLKLFSLNLSFIGWYIFSVLTFGIAGFWVAPYVTAANTIFYEELKNSQSYYEI